MTASSRIPGGPRAASDGRAWPPSSRRRRQRPTPVSSRRGGPAASRRRRRPAQRRPVRVRPGGRRPPAGRPHQQAAQAGAGAPRRGAARARARTGRLARTTARRTRTESTGPSAAGAAAPADRLSRLTARRRGPRARAPIWRSTWSRLPGPAQGTTATPASCSPRTGRGSRRAAEAARPGGTQGSPGSVDDSPGPGAPRSPGRRQGVDGDDGQPAPDQADAWARHVRRDRRRDRMTARRATPHVDAAARSRSRFWSLTVPRRRLERGRAPRAPGRVPAAGPGRHRAPVARRRRTVRATRSPRRRWCSARAPAARTRRARLLAVAVGAARRPMPQRVDEQQDLAVLVGVRGDTCSWPVRNETGQCTRRSRSPNRNGRIWRTRHRRPGAARSGPTSPLGCGTGALLSKAAGCGSTVTSWPAADGGHQPVTRPARWSATRVAGPERPANPTRVLRRGRGRRRRAAASTARTGRSGRCQPDGWGVRCPAPAPHRGRGQQPRPRRAGAGLERARQRGAPPSRMHDGSVPATVGGPAGPAAGEPQPTSTTATGPATKLTFGRPVSIAASRQGAPQPTARRCAAVGRHAGGPARRCRSLAVSRPSSASLAIRGRTAWDDVQDGVDDARRTETLLIHSSGRTGHPVGEHGTRDGLDVLRGDVVAAAQHGIRAGREEQGEGAARRGAHQQLLVARGSRRPERTQYWPDARRRRSRARRPAASPAARRHRSTGDRTTSSLLAAPSGACRTSHSSAAVG